MKITTETGKYGQKKSPTPFSLASLQTAKNLANLTMGYLTYLFDDLYGLRKYVEVRNVGYLYGSFQLYCDRMDALLDQKPTKTVLQEELSSLVCQTEGMRSFLSLYCKQAIDYDMNGLQSILDTMTGLLRQAQEEAEGGAC